MMEQQALKRLIGRTIEQLAAAERACSHAGTVEAFDFFSKNKLVSAWSTYAAVDAKNTVAQAQRSLDELARVVSLPDRVGLRADSDWIDLFLDFQFDFSVDILSLFNMSRRSDAAGQCRRVKQNLEALLDVWDKQDSQGY